jgi:hypothetical protein
VFGAVAGSVACFGVMEDIYFSDLPCVWKATIVVESNFIRNLEKQLFKK